MSLEIYQRLDAKTLNINLPTLQQGSLNVESYRAQANDLDTIIHGIAPNSGWQMYKSHTELSTNSPNKTGLIEAQYSNGLNSVHIKWTAGSYLVVHYQVTNQPSDNQLYKAQSMRLSNKAKPIQEAIYHIWYQQEHGKWTPQCQQFIGFTEGAE